ncbi:MAG: hypothetical protein ACTHU0_10445 [Kofleriaceae bacterium]
MAKLSHRLDRGPLGTGRDRNPDIALGDRIERIRCRIDLRDASPEWIVRDAEQARTRTPPLATARYLGVYIGYHYFAAKTAE